jgi:hypothetical protein
VVELDVFPGSDMPFLQRGVPLRYFAQGLQGFRSKNTPRDFHPDHLHVGLTLTVNTLPKAETGKLSAVPFSGSKSVRFALKTLNLIFHIGDNPQGSRGRFYASPVDLLLSDYLSTLGATSQRGLLVSGQNKRPAKRYKS